MRRCPVADSQERPAVAYMPPPAPECGTCRHEGNSLEDWPCRASMSAAGLVCWEPKDATPVAGRNPL